MRRLRHLLAGGLWGCTINDDSRVEMVLRMEPPAGSPAPDLTKKSTVSRLEIARQGDHYPVWFDPTDAACGPTRPPPVPRGRRPGRRRAAHAARRPEGQEPLADEEFEQQKQKLLGG